MNCRRCGAIIYPNENFCSVCGTPVVPSNNQIPVGRNNIQNMNNNYNNSQNFNNYQNPNNASFDNYNYSNDNANKMNFIRSRSTFETSFANAVSLGIIITIVGLLIIVGFFYYIYN